MKQIALTLLQLVSLAVPPVAVLLKMLRQSENIDWTLRRLSFGLALASVLFFILAATGSVLSLLAAFSLSPTLRLALWAAVLGLLPFVVFVFVLYREHQLAFG
ncbi:hypothetical protein [Haloarchaeobius amylolyticus]|uniref:hypothetical protein n=1 Tax=Haloarchaeobius amylolyticus TaxID=1198296 RepID=UPI0022705ACD|nr:hypothetical protein [Haloarchaeobius amylolyticus]